MIIRKQGAKLMKPLPQLPPEFIGRQDAINEFHSIRTLREQKNVLYIEAVGGSGKTWLLQEYIRQCGRQRRPWHTGPDDLEPELRPIDFYNLENRTVDGLRRSIVRRLGLERFKNFLEADNHLQNEKDPIRLAEARRDTDFWFFQETKRALREMGTYTALFFDTFEVVHNRRVGRWFLKEFLPSRAVTGAIIVFAGRPSFFEMPSNVHTYTLGAFSDIDTLDYYQKKWNVRPSDSDPEKSVIRACQGRPLLLDLVYFARLRDGTIADLANLPEKEFESRLVGRVTQKPELLSEVILSMAYLKRRYNRSIFEYQYGAAELSFDEVESQLKELPFIKPRPSEHPLTLHDEFQRMVSEHGMNWDGLTDELYPKIVKGWYEQAIASAQGSDQYLLQAEQVAYVLERDFQEGLSLYRKYFDKIKNSHLFDLNDMVWGEVAALLSDDRQAFELTLEQADWLFEIGRPADAAFWYEQLISPRYAKVRDPQSYSKARIRLGHSYLQLGEADQAGRLWEKSLEEALIEGKSDDLSSFSYNLGHVRHQQGHWEEALKLYEDAINFARNSKNTETRDIMGETYFVMARLRARQADWEQAVQELRTGLQITERLHSGQIRHIQALIFAGDVHRYLGDPLTAQGYYGHAWQLLRNMDGWFIWKTLVLAGLGAVYNISGRSRRENGEDLEGDFNDQQQSLEFFEQCLHIVRENDTESRLHQVFDRMGDLFLELNMLVERSQEKPLEEKVKTLVSRAGELSFPEERTWRFRLREPEQSFEMLDLLGKAQRLFDLALLQADKFGEPHYMFDSLTQAASVAQERGRERDLEYYATLASTLRGLDDPQQEKLFLSYLDLLGAHSGFKSSPKNALKQYASAALHILAGGVFGKYLLQQQLPKIQRNLLSVSPEDATQYCDFLSAEWAENRHLSNFVQGVKDQLLFFGRG